MAHELSCLGVICIVQVHLGINMATTGDDEFHYTCDKPVLVSIIDIVSASVCKL